LTTPIVIKWSFLAIAQMVNNNVPEKDIIGNLVDSASSDMLVLKIKPCMCQYKTFVETANDSLQQLQFIWRSLLFG